MVSDREHLARDRAEKAAKEASYKEFMGGREKKGCRNTAVILIAAFSAIPVLAAYGVYKLVRLLI